MLNTIDNFKVAPLRAREVEENLILEHLTKVIDTSGDKTNHPVYIPIVKEVNGIENLEMIKINYNQNYDFNKTIRINKSGLESDFVDFNGAKNMLLAPALGKHINSVLALELNKVASPIDATGLGTILAKVQKLYSKKHTGINECLIMNKATFEELLLSPVGEYPIIQKKEGIYLYNNDLQIFVIESVEGIVLVSLDNIYLLLNGSTIETKQDTELARAGKREFSSLYFIGIETIFKENVLSVK